jgi:hypothetical protein
MTRKWKIRKPRKTRKGGKGGMYPFPSFKPQTRESKIKAAEERPISLIEKLSSVRNPITTRAKMAAVKKEEELRGVNKTRNIVKYTRELKRATNDEKRKEQDEEIAKVKADAESKGKYEELFKTYDKKMNLIKEYQDKIGAIKAEIKTAVSAGVPQDKTKIEAKEKLAGELKTLCNTTNDIISKLREFDDGKEIKFLNSDGSHQTNRNVDQNTELGTEKKESKKKYNDEKKEYKPEDKGYYGHYPKKIKFLSDLEKTEVNNESSNLEPLSTVSERIYGLNQEIKEETDQIKKNNLTKKKQTYDKVFEYIRNNKIMENCLKKITAEKDIKYLLRDISNQALKNQTAIWTVLKESEISQGSMRTLGMAPTKKSAGFLKMLTDESNRRVAEKEKVYKMNKDQLFAFLNGIDTDRGPFMYSSKSQEKDVFLRRAVRMFRHIHEIKKTEDLKFFTRIILCIIYKFYNNPDDPKDKQPFETKFNIDDVDIKNLTKFKLGEGDKHGIVNSLLKKLQTSLSCSSHIDKERRQKICHREDLIELKFPTKAKDHSQLTDAEMEELKNIKEDGMTVTEDEIVGSMGTILDIATGHENKLKLKKNQKTVLGPAGIFGKFLWDYSGLKRLSDTKKNIGTSSYTRRMLDLRRVKA